MLPVDLFYRPCHKLSRYAVLEMIDRISDVPSLWLKKSGERSWLGVINWQDEPQQLSVEPAHIGATQQAILEDILTGDEIALPATIKLETHQGRIFEVKSSF